MATLVLAVRNASIPEGSDYSGSGACESCHAGVHAAWSDSQHTKMMRRVDEPGVVVADFGPDDPERLFDLHEAVWAIGGKWEQQFMGVEDGHETLLPGAWWPLEKRWDVKAWDGWELPDPLRRCHGCHTVGLDVETGTFVEPNIGCESCHGPSEWHVRTWGLGAVTTTVDSQVCGQCHHRGTTPDGAYHFPVGYRPGDDLQAFFRGLEPSPGQNSSHWWGNGHPRQRHQEYPSWAAGGHADSLTSLGESYDGRFGDVTEDCLGCHAAEAALDPGGGWRVDDVKLGITCSVCHPSHGDLAAARIACQDCHTDDAFYHEPERGADHVPCPEAAQVSCVSCHMPKTVVIGGRPQLHSHRAGFVPPRDTAAWGVSSGCANGGCHAGVETATLQAWFDAHYGDAPASEKVH
ncbi:MAG: cytochrome c family protein [Proteobacteria bacterium]|nr:cytochrome c family protein [Pseudomonadota bacterium]